MDNWTFGWTLMVVGMGGTVAALGMFALMMGLLKRMFPVVVPPPKSGTAPNKSPGASQRSTGARDDEVGP